MRTARRFVHRDVKPGNVLIGLVETPHRAYLVDFGVAKDVAENAKATQHGLFLGTAEYASPEQIHGAALDARSDVYSLACTAFELLTGSSPFGSGPDDSARIAAPPPGADPQRRRTATVPARCGRPGVGRTAWRRTRPGDRRRRATSCRRSTTPSPSRRSCSSGRRPVRPRSRRPPEARRRWWIPAAIAAGATALLIAGMVVVRSLGDDEASPPPTTVAATTLPATTVAPTTLPATTLPPTTVAPPPSTLPPVPAGALDLGFGAYVPLADGWQVAGLDANAAELTDGVTSISIVVQQRTPGATARDVLVDRVAGVDGAFPSVWYGVPAIQPGTGGAMASQRASVGYRAFGDGGATSGQAIGVVRADGLAVGYVQRAAPGTASTSYPGLDEAIASLVNAPPVAAPAEIPDPGTAALPSSHPQLSIDGLAGLTPAPSYRVVNAQASYAFLTADGVHDVIASGHVVGTPGELVDIARQGMGNTYPGATFSAQTDFGPDANALIHSSVHGVGHVLRRAPAGRHDRHVLGPGHDARLLVRPGLVRDRGRRRTVRRRGPVDGVAAVRLVPRHLSPGAAPCSAPVEPLVEARRLAHLVVALGEVRGVARGVGVQAGRQLEVAVLLVEVGGDGVAARDAVGDVGEGGAARRGRRRPRRRRRPG